MTLAENDVSDFNFLQLPLADNFFVKTPSYMLTNVLSMPLVFYYIYGHPHKYETLL